MTIKPMLASPAATVPTGKDYICEPKFDGWRATLEDGNLYTRSGKPITQVPYITDALANLPAGTILDGEIVNLDGTHQWKRTQSILGSDAIHVPGPDAPLTYVVFDLLELMGKNLRAEELSDRKKLLSALLAMVPAPDIVRVCEELPCTDESLERLVNEGYEGVVCKRRSSHYYLDTRTSDWLKVKPENEVEVLCTGMYAPDRGSKYEGNAVGGFEFEVTHEGITYEGRCGTGMDNAMREDMLAHPENYIGRVAEVKHWGIGDTGALRFPSLRRFRDPADKPSIEDEPTQVAPSPVVEVENASGMSRAMLLDKLLDLEDDNDTLREENATLQARLNGTVERTVRGGRIRNYGAMKSSGKLIGAIEDMRRGAGDGFEKALAGSGDVQRELRKAESVAREKGWL